MKIMDDDLTDDLTTPYKPVAITYRDSDMLEYVNCDTMTIAERIDDNLSILRDKEGKIVGMSLANWSKIRR